MAFQVSRGEYVYHVGICGKLMVPQCGQSSLCRLRHDGAATDIRKYSFNKMILESGHLKLVYDLESPGSCGNKSNFLDK